MRLVLTWGPNPSDFDSEVKFFDIHGNVLCRTYYADKTSCIDETTGLTYMNLDVDELNVRNYFFLTSILLLYKIKLHIFQGGTNGPETITVSNVPDGVTAMYYIYDFSQQCGNGMSFKDSEGLTTIYGPNGAGWFSFD